MRIDNDTIEAIRARARIEEVVAEHVALKRRGKDLWGLCPFHHERTPSFTVAPEKALFYCFGCGKGGDVVTFLKELRGMDYMQAMTMLADRYGVEIDYDSTRASNGHGRDEESQRLLLAYAADYYHRHLLAPGGSKGLAYLSKRGILSATIAQYGVGYADDSWDSLYKQATKDAYTQDALVRAGLCKHGKRGLYDVLRGRIIFPIQDATGRVLAFGGRALPGADEPKYLNFSDTPLYKKGWQVYGLHQAKESIRQHGMVYLVEGYMDVLAMRQADIAHVVSPLGTALTRTQARLLSRFTRRVVVLFDGDAAGVAASLRSIDVLLAEQMEVAVVSLPDGMDPDECLTKVGKEDFMRCLREGEKNCITFMLAQLSGGKDDTKVASNVVIKRILESVAKSPSPLVRASLLKLCAAEAAFKEEVLAAELAVMLDEDGKLSRVSRPQAAEQAAPAVNTMEQALHKQERECLTFLLHHGDQPIGQRSGEFSIHAHCMREIGLLAFTQSRCGSMLSAIREQSAAGTWRGYEHFIQQASEEEKKVVAAILLSRPALSKRWQEKIGGPTEPSIDEILALANKTIMRLRMSRTHYEQHASSADSSINSDLHDYHQKKGQEQAACAAVKRVIHPRLYDHS